MRRRQILLINVSEFLSTQKNTKNALTPPKKTLDENIAELQRINQIAAQVETLQKFNVLLNLGTIAAENIRLTKIRAEGNFLELEGTTDDSDALKDYLERVKSYVAESARLESSSERDDGEIVFVIRAALE